jgi:potassium-transporting ATPase KdpC subunit
MSLLQETKKAISITLGLWVLTAIIYPLLILVVGQVILPSQANGSLIRNSQGQPIGSALIGQAFTSDRYFQSRPSTIDYSQGEKAQPTGTSGASNLAPSNPDLLKRIQEQVDSLKKANIKPSADLVYTSGSGLDPHITLSAAQAQLNRIARSRNIPPNQVTSLIDQNSDRRFLGIFGEPGVNVLKLNYALDRFRN